MQVMKVIFLLTDYKEKLGSQFLSCELQLYPYSKIACIRQLQKANQIPTSWQYKHQQSNNTLAAVRVLHVAANSIFIEPENTTFVGALISLKM